MQIFELIPTGRFGSLDCLWNNQCVKKHVEARKWYMFIPLCDKFNLKAKREKGWWWFLQRVRVLVIFIVLHLFIVWVCVCHGTLVEVRGQLGSQFAPVMCVPGIGLRLTGLVAGPCNNWALSLAQDPISKYQDAEQVKTLTVYDEQKQKDQMLVVPLRAVKSRHEASHL